jgi:spoIIIJ-associated protein
MKSYVGKTLEEVLNVASEELSIPVDEISYEITKEEKKLFSKKIEIIVFTIADVIEFSEKYVKIVLSDLGLEDEVKSTLDDGVIRIALNTSHNAVLIGKNGQTLQALNSVVRQAVSHKFKRHYSILLDINSYKDEKYEKLIRMAMRIAKEVQKTKVNAVLDPMTSDERRIIHNALSKMKNIKTESSGQGYKRQITIYYVE